MEVSRGVRRGSEGSKEIWRGPEWSGWVWRDPDGSRGINELRGIQRGL